MGIMILLKSRATFVFSIAILIYSVLIGVFARDDINIKLKKLLIIFVITPIFFFINSNIFEKQYKFSTKGLTQMSLRNYL